MEVKGFRTGLPRCATLVRKVLGAEGNWGPIETQFMRNFYLSLKEFKSGALPLIRIIIRNNSFVTSLKTSNYWMSTLLTILQMTFLPSETPRHLTSPLAHPCIYLIILSISDPLVYVEFHAYMQNQIWWFSLVNLSHFNFIIRPGERTQKDKETLLPSP